MRATGKISSVKYQQEPLFRYIDDLAAKLPAPGGGSASALAACLGASLISMVVNFTLGKPAYAKYEASLEQALNKSERLRKEFLHLVDLDVVAYKSKNIRDALGVPLMTCRLCFEAIRLCPKLLRQANINLISDVAVAAELLEAAYAAAYFNVKINLKSLQDKKTTEATRKELDRKEKLIKKIRLETEAKVDKIIGR